MQKQKQKTTDALGTMNRSKKKLMWQSQRRRAGHRHGCNAGAQIKPRRVEHGLRDRGCELTLADRQVLPRVHRDQMQARSFSALPRQDDVAMTLYIQLQ